MKYTGSITTSGKSEAIRFEKGLFRQNPEFKQQAKVEAHVIGPGQMLVSVVDDTSIPEQDDPIVSAFLSFLANDMTHHPEQLTALSPAVIKKAKKLTDKVAVSDDDVISDDVTF